MYLIVSYIQKIFDSTLSSVIANLISTLILAITGFSIYIFFYWKNRKDKLNFFGISNEKFDTRIYVSRLEIIRNGTEGNIPIDRGFIGPAIIKLEYEAALMIQNELESKTVALLPKKFRDWLGNQTITLNNLRIPINISPHRDQEHNIKDYINTHLFILGSSMYNLPSKYYLERYLPEKSNHYCYYEKNQEGERIIGIRFRHSQNYQKSSLPDLPLPGRSHNREIGFIHRFEDQDTGMMVFLCVGHGSSATYGSVKYLINKWRELYLKYKDKEFIICLAFEDQEANAELVVEPEVIWPTDTNFPKRY